MNIVLLGPPGSGKGTQARIVAAERGMLHLSTGEMLRAAVKAETDVGRRARAAMETGGLVSDEIVTAVVSDRLDEPDVAGGVIFDGFPRTDAQARALDGILVRNGMDLDAVVSIDVDDDLLVDRVSGRFTCARCGEGYHDVYKQPAAAGICNNCGGAEFKRRADDNPETMRARLNAYHSDTKPLISYYRGSGKLKTVDGAAEIAEVARAITAALDG